MKYKIYPVFLGSADIDKSQAVYFAPIGEKVHIHYGMFALKGEDGEFVLVDSGIPSQEEIKANGYPYPTLDDATDLLEELGKLGVDPLKVKTIILTHLHWDHAWNLDKFPNATIYVQRKEMAHAVTPYKHEKNDYCMTEETLCKGWTKGILRMRALEGDVDVVPGISVIVTPGHTPGSQTVLVDTAEGRYALVGDWAYTQENITNHKAVGDVLDNVAWYQSYDKIMNTHAIILPTHDDAVLEREYYG